MASLRPGAERRGDGRPVRILLLGEYMGIPPEDLPHTSEPFYRTIAVASEVGQGTTFTVRLPLVRVEEDAPELA